MLDIQNYLDFFALHPYWALAIIFFVSMGEALLVIGLFIPSTAVLVGAGALVGSGKLDFWPVMIATLLGCILGDQISYWAGRFFGERLRVMWPLKNYPHLLAKGEDFVRSHGGKSIAIGRFVPGVKAVVPGIAGMFGMSQAYFLAVNVSSGLVWTVMHLFPGILLGQALAVAGELSGRLLVVLLVLVIILGVTGWLVRVAAAMMTPYRKALQGRLAAMARRQGSKPMRRLSKIMAPENPNSTLFFMLLVLAIFAIVALADLVLGLEIRHAVGNIDRSLFNLFNELRNAPGDEIFVRVTMLGDDIVIFITAGAIALWLAAHKAWRAAVATMVAVITAKIVLLLTSTVFSTPVINTVPDAFVFPSPHALMAGTLFGTMAALSARGLSRWAQALVVSVAFMLVIAISFSRIYLGVSWLSDVLGGILLAAILTTLFSVYTATVHMGRFRPIALLGVTFAAFILAGAFHISADYNEDHSVYVAQDKTTSLSLATWTTTGWATLPQRRIDLAGRLSEQFIGQWIGTPEELEKIVTPMGFQTVPKWKWTNYLPYLDPHAPLSNLSPRPTLHLGLRAKLTAYQTPPNASNYRLTLRAYQSTTFATDGAGQRVYLVSLTHEKLKPQLQLMAIPSDVQASKDEAASFLAAMVAQPGVETLDSKQGSVLPIAIWRPKLP
jgi:membrane protein DedA with SNARE-associated domain/membrane-associated phospholipid phosphatase